MAVLKYSKQREAIRDFLAHSEEHPTADMVYMNLRESFPNIESRYGLPQSVPAL